MNIKIQYKKVKRNPDNFRELPLTGILPKQDSEIREAIVGNAKTNTILKCPINKIFSK